MGVVFLPPHTDLTNAAIEVHEKLLQNHQEYDMAQVQASRSFSKNIVLSSVTNDGKNNVALKILCYEVVDIAITWV